MGLDMYAWRVKPQDAIDEFTIAHYEDDSEGGREELYYWRKHHDLHGWMEKLYYAKGGDASSFNCVYVRLAPEDLDKLEQDIRARRLPSTEGFFFGNNPPDDDSDQHDLIFINRARNAIAEGDSVYYSSWW